MLNDNRQQYVIQTDSTKEDGLGKVIAFIFVASMFLAFVQEVFESVMAWYRDTMVWLNETATYVAGFWPF
ncbi:hypothetical protein GOD74_32000 [Sinorhizobium medicae]|uniref:Uncharacterized protein n=1 Tax=Pseudorhizobium halotolerans TaxID=1233081 RepID=A0ABM8PF26_9HYPH|nr:hypothetical protein [Pseudorhizobium halotolerans]MDX0840186.1 hypothetical protein [Sinorhizobium medicae]MDX0852869.1 hypothetical protein [Sinorhizobium medicae]CAD7026289.1 hypothetical protein RHAB21_01272 [Pseudorhizobium halotolerans]